MKKINFETEFDAKEKYFFKRLLGDERRYLQILINFLSNAIKFSLEKSRIIVGLRINDHQIKSQDIPN
jgi:signal transduction histidine kinase